MIVFKFIFFIGVIAIPFSGINGIGALGETSSEASVYIFLPLVAMAVPFLFLKNIMDAGSNLSFKTLNIIIFSLLVFMTFSLFINFADIRDASYLGRSGFNKFITASMVVTYGVLLSYYTYSFKKEDVRSFLIIPTAIAVSLCCFYSFFEITAQFSGLSSSIANAISSIIHNTPGVLKERLRSVAYEPPALANYAAFAWPWMYAAYKYSQKNTAKFIYFCLWIAITLLPLAAISRTGMLTVFTGIAGLMLLNLIYLSRKPVAIGFQRFVSGCIIVSVIALVGLIAIYSDTIINSVTRGDSVSNLSRLASNVAAFKMMMEQPFAGFGWGQYGFYAYEHLPGWGWNSWEIRNWFSGLGAWPPVFSIYARLGAETGITGVLLWILLWVGLAYKILKAAQRQQALTGAIPKLAKPLILSCLCVLCTGIPLDSLRMPMIWIVLGICCRFLDDHRTKKSGTHIEEENAVKSPFLHNTKKPLLRDNILR